MKVFEAHYVTADFIKYYSGLDLETWIFDENSSLRPALNALKIGESFDDLRVTGIGPIKWTRLKDDPKTDLSLMSIPLIQLTELMQGHL